jgi:TolA-binding protein
MLSRTKNTCSSNFLAFINASIVLLCLLLGAILIFNSCVYFNIFYNARKYYRLGERENRDLPAGQPVRMQNYQRALDTAAKVPEFYPQSKYLDDAVILMGKCYFKMQMYPKAERKFKELISNFPQSEYVDEARLYLGKSLVENRSCDEARETLNSLINLSEDRDIVIEAELVLGKLLYTEAKYEQAIEVYRSLLEKGAEKKIKAEALFLMAKSMETKGEFTTTAETYKKASEFKSTSLKKRFEALYNQAICWRKAGDLEHAKKVLKAILKEQKFYSFFPQVNVEIAEIDLISGEVEKAAEELKKITVTSPKTGESARAFYDLGMINRDYLYDYKNAEGFLKNVATEKSDSPYIDSAKVALKILENLNKVTKEIDSLRLRIEDDLKSLSGAADTTFKTQPDSGYLKMRKLFSKEQNASGEKSPAEFKPDSSQMMIIDSLSKHPDTTRVVIDSTTLIAPEPVKIDTVEINNRLKQNYKELEKLYYQLAEVWLFQLGNSDSSQKVLTSLADTAEIEIATKALFLLAYISKKNEDSLRVDSIYQQIIDKSPQSPYAEVARKWLGLPLLFQNQIDSARVCFSQAEDAYYREKDPRKAYKTYSLVDSLYPNSDLAPRAMYARAYIAEKEFSQDSVAIKLLEQLQAKYPADTLAKLAKKRLTAPTTISLAPVTAETTMVVETERIYLPAEVDEPATCVEDSIAISRYISDNNLYPSAALSAGIKGIVKIAIVVDKYGYPGDAEVIEEIPPGYGFANSAKEVVSGLHYTAGKLKHKPVAVKIEMEIKFKI